MLELHYLIVLIPFDKKTLSNTYLRIKKIVYERLENK